MKGKLNDIVSYMTLVAGFVTIVWFIQDSRKENSKVLKRQEQILINMEEGQRKSAERQIKSLEAIEKSLERINESGERQIIILERIEAKYK